MPHMPQPARRISRRRAQCRLEEDAADERRLHPLLRRVFENRNVRTRGELDYALNNLHAPESLKGMEAATAILHRALDDRRGILIVGDYDADGATAASVALLGLRALGAGRADYLVPNRFEHGYGLSEDIARIALQKRPDVVITVDNGISSVDGVALLRAAGVAVVVTDHHLAGRQLPDADAIVNPNQPGCDFPSKALAGVGVVFYLLLALRKRLRAAGWFDPGRRPAVAEPNLAELLDLVALGTVADLVPLDHNNRILVAQGMMRIRGGRCRPGIKALVEIAGRLCHNLDTSDLGFIIGPRLNAAGRMDDMSTGIECLIADHPREAMRYAESLDQINAQRHQVQRSMLERAEQMVSELLEGGDDSGGRAGLCLFDADWHQGIVGLVASRIKDQLHRPTVAFARADDGRLRGSARSVAGLNIRDLLESVSTRHPGLIEQFGGHAMAAGLTIEERQFDAFSDCFSARVDAHFNGRLPDGEILTDGELAGGDLTLETAELVRAASPWGSHFPAPLFDGEFRVTDQRVVGDRHLKMVLECIDGSAALDAICFRHIEPGREAPIFDLVKAVYQLKVKEYRGRRSLQLVVEYMQPS